MGSMQNIPTRTFVCSADYNDAILYSSGVILSYRVNERKQIWYKAYVGRWGSERISIYFLNSEVSIPALNS